METEASFLGSGTDCGSDASDAAPERGHSEKSGTEEDGTKKPTESSHSPQPMPKKINFSISGILDEDGKTAPDGNQTDAGLTTASEVSNIEDHQAGHTTFFYREKLLSSHESWPSGEGGRSADAVISSWTVPPTPPLVYREYSRFATFLVSRLRVRVSAG